MLEVWNSPWGTRASEYGSAPRKSMQTELSVLLTGERMCWWWPYCIVFQASSNSEYFPVIREHCFHFWLIVVVSPPRLGMF